MPPRTRITRQMILDAALCITREQGSGAVNARSIAHALQCSTRPIFTCYENMQQLRHELALAGFEAYERSVEAFGRAVPTAPYLLLPLSYIEFARKEPRLFEFVFMDDMQLEMAQFDDFYREAGNGQKARAFAQALGVPEDRGRRIFLDLFLYAHAIAVLTAGGRLTLSREDVEERLQHLLTALVRQERADGGDTPKEGGEAR